MHLLYTSRINSISNCKTNKNNLRFISPIKIKDNDFNEPKKHLNIRKIKKFNVLQINKEYITDKNNEKIVNVIKENLKKSDNKTYLYDDKKDKYENNKNNGISNENK